MKLLVLGAAGKTGREVVKQALAAGHQVRAFVRAAEKLEAAEGLEIFAGDAENADDITRATAGMSAVISVLGHTNVAKSQPLTAAMKTLAVALPANTRVISLTGFGVPDEHDPATPITGRLINLAVKLIPGGMFNDGLHHVEALRASKLNWTVLRAALLTNGHSAGYELGYFRMGPQDGVARADVAAAMIAQLSDPKWSRQAPMIRGQR